MAFTEQTSYFLGVLNDGQVELRTTRHILEGTEIVGEKHHRQVLEPGADTTPFPAKIRAIAAVVWTPQVVSDFQAAKDARLAALRNP